MPYAKKVRKVRAKEKIPKKEVGNDPNQEEQGKEPKPEKKKSKNGKHTVILIALLIFTVLALAAAGLFAWNLYLDDQERKAKELEEAQPRIVIPAGFFDTQTYEQTLPKDIHSIRIAPGTDFYKDDTVTEEAASAELDQVMTQIVNLNMNSILVDTRMPDGRVIFASKAVQSTPVDLLKLITKKAAENGLTVSAVFHASDLLLADGTPLASHVSSVNRQALMDAAGELAVYELETLQLEDYYTKRSGDTYREFVSYGAVGDYNSWLLNTTNVALERIVETVRSAKNTLPVGIGVSSVWANAAAKEGGSETSADFQALIDGHADTKGLTEGKKIDFVDVNIPTSRSNGKVPFKTAVNWWANLCKASGVPMYVTHRGENLANGEAGAGWEATDELATQVADAKATGVWNGSIFSGLSRLVSNPGNATDILTEYLAGSYSENELRTRLNITAPSKLNTVTYEKNAQFRGTFDPNQEVTLNGKKVEPSERGGFSVWADLKVGMNTFVFTHKGQKRTYNIERKVVIFKSASPAGKTLKMAGSSQLGVSVVAYDGSKITASLNGQTIQLQPAGGTETGQETDYITYEGSFTLPKATAKEQSIGKISFGGSYEGYKESASGASVVVDKLPDEVDPDTATGQQMPMATVTSGYANTYPYNTTPSTAQSILYQLPYGTQDIVLSENGDFYNLRSGKTVKKSSVSLNTEEFPGNNAITHMTMGTEGNDTVIRLTMNWKSPFSLTLSPYPTTLEASGSKENYSFQANHVTLTFDYVTRIGAGEGNTGVSGNLNGSSIFSGTPKMERIKNKERNIWQYQMTLPLNETGRYYGCHAGWDGNTLVLRFNQAPQNGSLSGMNIVVDPGHGGKDTGNMAGRDVIEKNVNLLYAQEVAAALESRGANVVFTRTGDETVSLDQRTAIAHANNADLFISCHQNSAGANGAPHGVQVYYNAPFSQPLAQYVQAQLAPLMGDSQWNCWRGPYPQYNFVVTRERQYPSILIEFGFLSNLYDEGLAQDQSHRQAMAEAVAEGVVQYYASRN